MSGRRITILVGTDHHRFDRLVTWADAHQSAHPADTVVIQHGHSDGPEHATGVAFFSPDDLGSLAAESDFVITHGGPGTIMDVRKQGHRPITLARNPEHGEHVDDHQMRFAAWAADKDLVRLVTEVEEIDRLVADLESTRSETGGGHSTDDTAVRLSQLLENFDGRRLAVAEGATKVLHLTGVGSGSALVELALGSLDGVVVLGEVTHLWERALKDGGLCTCDKPFRECEFWTSIGERAFGGWDEVDLEHVLRLKASVDGHRRLHRSARRHPGGDLRRLLVEYSEYYRRIYDAAAAETGATIVVDSSKRTPTALSLSHNRHIDLRVLRVVRDRRARTRHRLTMRGLAYRGVHVTAVRSDQLLLTPDEEMARVWRDLDLPGEPRPTGRRALHVFPRRRS